MHKKRELRIALTGEGVTDYGWRDYASAQWREGAAAKLIRACGARYGFDVVFTFVARKDVDSLKLQARQLQGLKGKAIPARRFQVLLRKAGLSCGVFYCDADQDSGAANSRQQARKRFLQVYGEVRSCVESGGAAEVVIPMVALRMIEAWLLSDRSAFEEAFDQPSASGHKTAFPPHPELLWGKKEDTDSDYPKNLFHRIVKEWNNGAPPNREDYAKLAECLDLDELSRKCPISFQTFLTDFEQFLSDSTPEPCAEQSAARS